MPHPNEVLIRDIYDAFARGDMAGVAARCTDDVVFLVPGSSRVAGQYRGKAAFFETFLPALAAVADMGTFRETVDAVACDDDHGVILTEQSFTRNDGRSVIYRSAVIFAFRDGLMSGFTEHAGSQPEYDDAWA